MIQLLPHKDLYAIKVPLDATNYIIKPGGNISMIAFQSDSLMKVYESPWHIDVMPGGNWQILGEVTKDSILFDPFNIIERSSGREDVLCFKDYTKESHFTFSDPHSSFRSLLTINDLHFVNPMEKPDFLNASFYASECYDSDLELWQHYEDNLVEKVLIIKKL